MYFLPLQGFVPAADLGSFTRAAIALTIAQPALSRQIRLLKRKLRQNQLTRNGRNALPIKGCGLLLKLRHNVLHRIKVNRL